MSALALCALLMCQQAAPQARPVDEAQQVAIAKKAIEEQLGFSSMTEGQQGQLLKRVIASRERFLDSQQPKAYPETLYKFFRREQYELMEGNPIIGYFWVDQGFRWPQQTKTVQFDGISGINEARVIRKQAYYLAVQMALKHMGMTLGPSSIRLKGCAVSMNSPSNPSEARGVWMELQIYTPGGSVFYRLGVGKKTIGDSLGANIEAALRFAHVYEDGSLPRPKSLREQKKHVSR